MRTGRPPVHGEGGKKNITSEYRIWDSMLRRCLNPNHKAYRHYGARGINVCEGLRIYVNFLSLMGRKSKGYSLDRIDNDYGYWCGRCGECVEKGQALNLRWATKQTQRLNSRQVVRLLTIDGETHSIAEWERRAGLHVDRIRARLKMGWPINRDLLQPPKYNSNYSHDAHKRQS